MENILFYLVGFITTVGVIYIAYALAPVYNNVKVRLTKKIGADAVEFLERKALSIVRKIEEDFAEDYFSDPNGTHRHNVARELLKDIIKRNDLEDRVSEADIDDFIEGSVKAADLVKGKNPFKKK